MTPIRFHDMDFSFEKQSGHNERFIIQRFGDKVDCLQRLPQNRDINEHLDNNAKSTSLLYQNCIRHEEK